MKNFNKVYQKIRIQKQKEEKINGKIRYYYSINNVLSFLSNILILTIRKFFYSLTNSCKIIAIKNKINKLNSLFDVQKGIREPLPIFSKNISGIYFSFVNPNIIPKRNIIFLKKKDEGLGLKIFAKDLIFDKNVIKILNPDHFLCYLNNASINYEFLCLIGNGFVESIDLQEIIEKENNDISSHKTDQVKQDKIDKDIFPWIYLDTNFSSSEFFQYDISKKTSFYQNVFLDTINFSFVCNSFLNESLMLKEILKSINFLFSCINDSFVVNNPENILEKSKLDDLNILIDNNSDVTKTDNKIDDKKNI